MPLQNKERLLQLYNQISSFKGFSSTGVVLITLKNGKTIMGKTGDVMFDKETGVGYIVVANEKILLRDIQNVQ